MHELAITEGIMEAAIPEAEKAGAKKINEIRIKIGELSGVLPECIEYYFNIVSKGTIAEGAKIVPIKIPVGIECPDCGYSGDIDRKKIICKGCGGKNFKVVRGREYFVDSLDCD